ncbi:hypothetical protein SO802_014929 [Lithocarpus litseifolius]|uniref:Uncharacterized protein n=1 Tax=Lithocarpus litseifolius TaxID=425828 RepID=A0AAW2CUP9_9ROSI
MKKVKACELCSKEASMYCASLTTFARRFTLNFGSDYDSSASFSDYVSSSESCTTGPKRVKLEDRSEEEEKKKKKKKKKVVKRSISSSVTEISHGGNDSVFPAKISLKKRRKVVDEKAEGTATLSSKRGGSNFANL